MFQVWNRDCTTDRKQMQSAVHQLWKLPCSSLEKSDDSGNDGTVLSTIFVDFLLFGFFGVSASEDSSRALARSGGPIALLSRLLSFQLLLSEVFWMMRQVVGITGHASGRSDRSNDV